ncbi:unnamed protein product [Urochloa decumbens]|uniref:Uncharacterized protein n=1 Tax=Urochloa decumbens TaxID=240449 RepID=A0ABC9A3B3_9POAL
MAGSGPGGSNGGATGTFLSGPVNPASDEAMTFISDYNVSGVIAMLAEHSHCSIKEKIELFRKNLESFRKFPKVEPKEDMQYEDDVDVVDDEDEVDVFDDEDDEDDEMEDEMGEREEIHKSQLTNDDERECKKPRFAEGFGCQGEAELFI